MNTAPTDLALTQALRHVLPQARAAWVFGSVARGQWHEGSDVDLAVVLPQPLSSDGKLAASRELADALGQDVDLLEFMQLHTVMQAQVLETGRLLFDDAPVQLAHYCAFVRTEYQHLQTWRQPMIAQLGHRLAHT